MKKTPQLTKDQEKRFDDKVKEIELFEGEKMTAEFYGLDEDDWEIIKQHMAEECEKVRQDERNKHKPKGKRLTYDGKDNTLSIGGKKYFLKGKKMIIDSGFISIIDKEEL